MGARLGMYLSAAHAVIRQLQVRERDGSAERELLERLAAWACQYTSFVSLAPPAALLLEVGASGSLFGGLEALLQRINRGVEELGFRAWQAVAPTALAALWLARSGAQMRVIETRALFSALAGLPLQCLELDPKREALLSGMGIVCIADCLRLPRDGLARRAGPEIVQAFDRALGRTPEARAAFIPPRKFHANFDLPAPVDATEALLFPLHRLLGELVGLLSARAAGIQRLTLALHHANGGVTRIDVGFSAPTRDAGHMMTVIRERLERSVLSAPVEQVALQADELRPLAARNVDFFLGGSTPGEARAQLLERLRARLGRGAVRGLNQLADHRPERAWGFIEPGQPATCSESRPGTVARPLWLLPEPVILEQREGGPWLGGALILEDERERIESGWWDGAVARDYFVARDESGARFWVFRELYNPRRWFLHGVFG